MEAYYETTKLPNGKLKVTYADSYTHDLSGDRARAMGTSPEDIEWQKQNPTLAAANRYGHTDDRNSLTRDFGTLLGKAGEETEGNPFLNNGAVGGAVFGGGLGALGGAGLGYLYNLLSGGNTSVGKWATLAGLTGAVLGGINADVRRRAREKSASVTKSAAMYQDPRNFILEKLQSANDVSLTEKATLAAKVRAMSRSDADRLAKSVRAAVGFGVGALIARFFFGTGVVGSALGGLMGLAGYNLLSGLITGPKPVNLHPTYKPLTYLDLL